MAGCRCTPELWIWKICFVLNLACSTAYLPDRWGQGFPAASDFCLLDALFQGSASATHSLVMSLQAIGMTMYWRPLAI